MRKKKQNRISLLTEEKAQEQYANNEEFFDFVNKQKMETFDELTGKHKEIDYEICNRIFVAGLNTLIEYSRQCNEFECVVGLFVESFISYAKKLSDKKIKRQELWKLYYTVCFAIASQREGKDNGMLDFLERRIMYTLHMYLWSDYCKLKNIRQSKQ